MLMQSFECRSCLMSSPHLARGTPCKMSINMWHPVAMTVLPGLHVGVYAQPWLCNKCHVQTSPLPALVIYCCSVQSCGTKHAKLRAVIQWAMHSKVRPTTAWLGQHPSHIGQRLQARWCASGRSAHDICCTAKHVHTRQHADQAAQWLQLGATYVHIWRHKIHAYAPGSV